VQVFVWTCRIACTVVVVYACSYFLLVRATSPHTGPGPGVSWPKLTKYAFGGHVSERLFGPINRLDREIRVSVWWFDNGTLSPSDTNGSGRSGPTSWRVVDLPAEPEIRGP
jgi:hypothetical protein